MSVTVYFANVAKKRNSTLQGTFTTSYDCVMKAPTSLDRPTFLVSAETMDYNAAKMGNRYYFIDDVVSVRNGQWEVSCVLDVTMAPLELREALGLGKRESIKCQ